MSERFRTPFGPRATAGEVLTGVRLTGKRMIVTGGSSGIGAETARALAQAGADVTVAVRTPASAEPLIAEAKREAWTGTVRAAELDLSDLASVHAFAKTWDEPVHALVANAGVMALPELQRAANGWEMQLATNYLGHFALALALHDALAAASGARIVVVSSGAHRKHPFDFDDPQFDRTPYDRWAAYGRSKSADVLLAVGLADRWRQPAITANACMPGWINTDLQRHLDLPTLQAMGGADEHGNRIEQPHFKSPQQGAATSVMLAASPLLNGITGHYFEDNQQAAVTDATATGGVAAHAIDPGNADRLWNYSEPYAR